MNKFQEMKEMMKLLLKMTMDSRTNAVVYRNKANANAHQVKWLAKYCTAGHLVTKTPYAMV
jgi:hypothetical protein